MASSVLGRLLTRSERIRQPMAPTEEWILRRRYTPRFLQRVPHVPEIVARVLYARGIHEPQEIARFLNPGGMSLQSPYALPDMAEAVQRLARALQENHPIAVYGDFDCDGVTATTLLVSALERLGGTASAYIPDRFQEGYGLNMGALRSLHESGVELVVTVDCGIRSRQEVAYARELGLDMVITDHHSAPAELPPAAAVVDAKRQDHEDTACHFREFSGVGVAYNLVRALCDELGATSRCDPEDYLDLVALGTVADIVPLRGDTGVFSRSLYTQ